MVFDMNPRTSMRAIHAIAVQRRAQLASTGQPELEVREGIQKITIFEVRETINERGTLGAVVGYCDSKTTADERAKGEGWWGGQGAVSEVSALVIDGHVWALRQPEPVQVMNLEQVRVSKPVPQSEIDTELRSAALAKLSPDARRVLGYAT
jgi:hypothetical protein